MQFLTTEIPDNIYDITLSDEESFHLKKVLRVKTGDEIKIFDGKNQWLACVTGFDGRKTSLKLIKKIPVKEKKYTLNLYVPFIERKYFELVIKMGTELGVDRFIPFSSDYTQKHYEFDINEKNLRIQEIIISAVKQSERNSIPSLSESLKFKDIFSEKKNIIIASNKPVGGKIYNINNVISMKLYEFNIVVGPEGGFSDDELSLMEKHDCKALILSGHVLRSQTAAVAAASAVSSVMEMI